MQTIKYSNYRCFAGEEFTFKLINAKNKPAHLSEGDTVVFIIDNVENAYEINCDVVGEGIFKVKLPENLTNGLHIFKVEIVPEEGNIIKSFPEKGNGKLFIK